MKDLEVLIIGGGIGAPTSASLLAAMLACGPMNFLLASALGHCLAVAIGISPSRMRAVSSTMMMIASGIIGGAMAPLIVGAVSDALPRLGQESLRYGLATMASAPLVAGFLLWAAFRRISRNVMTLAPAPTVASAHGAPCMETSSRAAASRAESLPWRG